jgi:hypothetical protein
VKERGKLFTRMLNEFQKFEVWFKLSILWQHVFAGCVTTIFSGSPQLCLPSDCPLPHSLHISNSNFKENQIIPVKSSIPVWQSFLDNQ